MKLLKISFSIILLICTLLSCNTSTSKSDQMSKHNTAKMNDHVDSSQLETAVFGAGCFWCVEAQFELLDGVVEAESGYAGGHTPNPSYKEVCTGNTGHAEVVKIYYDPNIISYEELLGAFFMAHDPTTLNRQGNDVGTQYRSAIFYSDDTEKHKAEEIIDKLNAENVFPNPIVSTLEPLGTFYPAEKYHQQYFELNGEQPYCQMVVKPKYEKFKKVMAEKIKK